MSKCKNCGKEFEKRFSNDIVCSPRCASAYKFTRAQKKKAREPKKNLFKKVKVNKELAEYIKIRGELKKEQIKKLGYTHCELCSKRTFVTAHHIFPRGRYPHHPNLHHRENLLMVCINCHSNIHSTEGGVQEIIDKFGNKKLFE